MAHYKFTEFDDGMNQAVALDKLSYDSETETLTAFSSVDPTVKEEVTIPQTDVDSELDETSENPVQNKVVAEAINTLMPIRLGTDTNGKFCIITEVE